MSRRAARLSGPLALVLLAGCAAPPAPAPPPEAGWFLATAEELPGVWESVALEVAPDGAILTLYAFHADGSYEVVVVAYARRLLLLSSGGRWRQAGAGIDFVEDGEAPYPARTRGRRLRLRRGARELELERVLDDDPAPGALISMPLLAR